MGKYIESIIRKNMGYGDLMYPTLDPNTPWYNFNLYCESCYSLGFRPSVTSFGRYNQYYKSLFNE